MKDGHNFACRAFALWATICFLPIAVEAGYRVRTVPTPEHGKPLAAAADAKGNIHLLYDTADGPRYVRSSDDGKSFSAATPLVDKAARKPGLVFHVWDMAVEKGGRVHVAVGTNAWKLKLPHDQWGYYYATLEPGAKSFTALRNINNKPSEGFSLAVDDKGTVAACWMADKLYANVSRDHGKTFGPIVEIDPAYDPCNCCTTRSVFAADGKLAVLYREETNDERDMHLVLWDIAKKHSTRKRISDTPWKINACPMTYYSIARTSGGFVAIWPTGPKYDIYLSLLDSKGAVLPPGEVKTSGHAGHRTGMLALNAADGSTLAAWTKNDQVGWQLFDAMGRPSGSAGAAKTSGKDIAGVVDREGRFLLFR